MNSPDLDQLWARGVVEGWVKWSHGMAYSLAPGLWEFYVGFPVPVGVVPLWDNPATLGALWGLLEIAALDTEHDPTLDAMDTLHDALLKWGHPHHPECVRALLVALEASHVG